MIGILHIKMQYLNLTTLFSTIYRGLMYYLQACTKFARLFFTDLKGRAFISFSGHSLDTFDTFSQRIQK